MATITQAAFAVSWTSAYESILDGSAGGLLETQAKYNSTFDHRPGELTLPWLQANNARHWSKFWAAYLSAPTKIFQLTGPAGWDRCVPFRWLHGYGLEGPASVTGAADVLIYPAAISVIMRVTASSNWTLDNLANSIADIRGDNTWTLHTPATTSSNRNLVGMAADLRDGAVKWLSSQKDLQPSAQAVYSVAAPVLGTGTPAELSVADPVAASCLTGLAVLGPPGAPSPGHLLDMNSDPNDAGRVYWLNGGHAIWHAARLVNPQKTKSIECLLSNHIELIAHIDALGGVVSWADAQLQSGAQIPFPTLEMVQRSALRLDQLNQGDRTKTYRSEMAKIRIAALLTQLNNVRVQLGP